MQFGRPVEDGREVLVRLDELGPALRAGFHAAEDEPLDREITALMLHLAHEEQPVVTIVPDTRPQVRQGPTLLRALCAWGRARRLR